MSELDQPFKPLPVNDDIIVKLPEGTEVTVAGNRLFTLYRADDSPICTTKEFLKRAVDFICRSSTSGELFHQGIKATILEPRKKWVAGKFRLRLIFEFVPDEVDELDELRNMNL